MASRPEKRNDQWYVQVCVNKVRRSKSWPTKAEALAWAVEMEKNLRTQHATGFEPIADRTFGELLLRYKQDVIDKKESDGARQSDTSRINGLIADKSISGVRLEALSTLHVVAWRNRRVTEVSNLSTKREMTVMSSACSYAKKELKWLNTNPLKDVDRPKEPKPRSRRYSEGEITAILQACAYVSTQRIASTRQLVAAVMLFAIETAMRAGEIVDMKWHDVHLPTHVHVPKTKNGDERDVALSAEAERILDQVKGLDEKLCFPVSKHRRGQLFKTVTDECGLENIRFHDTRREALTRLSAKIPDPRELARMSGHRDLNMLLKVYYAPDVKDTAKKLR